MAEQALDKQRPINSPLKSKRIKWREPENPVRWAFAIAEQEFEEGINAIAAPIFDRNQQPIASISVAGPAYRLTREKMLAISQSVISATREIAEAVTHLE